MLSVQTKTAPLLLTVIDLASNHYDDVCDYGPIRDYRTVRVLSRRTLPQTAIANVARRNPGYTVVGIRENDYRNDEF
jgi:hypothetical protein